MKTTRQGEIVAKKPSRIVPMRQFLFAAAIASCWGCGPSADERDAEFQQQQADKKAKKNEVVVAFANEVGADGGWRTSLGVGFDLTSLALQDAITAAKLPAAFHLDMIDDISVQNGKFVVVGRDWNLPFNVRLELDCSEQDARAIERHARSKSMFGNYLVAVVLTSVERRVVFDEDEEPEAVFFVKGRCVHYKILTE